MDQGPSVRRGFTPAANSNCLVAIDGLLFHKIAHIAKTLEKMTTRMDQGPSVRWGFTPTAVYSRRQSDIKLNRYHWQARNPATTKKHSTMSVPMVNPGWHGMPCHYEKNLPSGHLKCDILPSQTRWQTIGHPPESSRLAERLQAPAERVRPHSTAPPPGAWLR